QCDEEYEAAGKVGAIADHGRGVPLKGHEAAPVLRYPDQATFHPLKYLRALLDDFRERGGKAFAESAVTEIEEGEQIRLRVEGGATITADNAVFATNSPVNTVVAIHSKMAPYRTYAMAFELPKATLPDALYWDMDDPYYYVRLQPGEGDIDYLIAGGRDHKSGEADDGSARFDALDAWIAPLSRNWARKQRVGLARFSTRSIIADSSAAILAARTSLSLPGIQDKESPTERWLACSSGTLSSVGPVCGRRFMPPIASLPWHWRTTLARI
ncbi:MAG: FAD-binding oxidoreductase, partial [Mesorhizobium sp.]